jgi:hypothetical protein
MAKASPEIARFSLPTPSMTAKILIFEPPRTAALHPAMKGRCPWYCLGWLMGYNTAT